MPDDLQKAKMLVGLAPILQMDAELSKEVLTAVLAIKRFVDYERLFSTLVPFLHSSVLRQAFDTCAVEKEFGYDDPPDRIDVITKAASDWPSRQLSDVVVAVRSLDDKDLWNSLICQIAPNFVGEYLEEGLKAIATTEEEHARIDALLHMIRTLQKQCSRELLRRTHTAMLREEWSRACLLASWPAERLDEIIIAAETLEVQSRADVLSTMVMRLPGKLLMKGLEAISELESESLRAIALQSLIQSLVNSSADSRLSRACELSGTKRKTVFRDTVAACMFSAERKSL